MPIKKDPGVVEEKPKIPKEDIDHIPDVYKEQFGEEFAKELFNKSKLTEPIKEVKVFVLLFSLPNYILIKNINIGKMETFTSIFESQGIGKATYRLIQLSRQCRNKKDYGSESYC